VRAISVKAVVCFVDAPIQIAVAGTVVVVQIYVNVEDVSIVDVSYDVINLLALLRHFTISFSSFIFASTPFFVCRKSFLLELLKSQNFLIIRTSKQKFRP